LPGERVERETFGAQTKQLAIQHGVARSDGGTELRAHHGAGELALAAKTRRHLRAHAQLAAQIIGRERRDERDAAGPHEGPWIARGNGELEARDEREAVARAAPRVGHQRVLGREADVADRAARQLVVGAEDVADPAAVLVERDGDRRAQLEALGEPHGDAGTSRRRTLSMA
jgi:hypothetical protein